MRISDWSSDVCSSDLLVELHPEDEAALRVVFRGDRQVSVHRRDAYEAAAALLPPPERRGLVLIDPAFEVTDEFARMVAGLGEAHRRRSEEHTSELQSLMRISYAVFCLKKKKKQSHN